MAALLPTSVVMQGTEYTLVCNGDLDPPAWAELKRKALALLADGNATKLTLDLSAVEFASPTGVEDLLDVAERCEQQHVDFDLESNPRLHRVLELLQLDMLEEVPDAMGMENEMRRVVGEDDRRRNHPLGQ